MEGGPLLKDWWVKASKDVVLYLNIDAQWDGAPEQNLLKKKGGWGYPYCTIMNAKGDVTGSKAVAWRRIDAAPYVASPLVYDDLLYFSRERNGILNCVDSKTGKGHYNGIRLQGSSTLYASLVGAAGKVYVTGHSGTTHVIKHGPKFELLSTNQLGEGVDASPVIVGKQLFIRGRKHLFCISEK